MTKILTIKEYIKAYGTLFYPLERDEENIIKKVQRLADSRTFRRDDIVAIFHPPEMQDFHIEEKKFWITVKIAGFFDDLIDVNLFIQFSTPSVPLACGFTQKIPIDKIDNLKPSGFSQELMKSFLDFTLTDL